MERISEHLITFLLNAFWQIVAIGAVAALAAWFMRNGPARYRHALWVAALLASVLLPALSVVRRAPAASLPHLTIDPASSPSSTARPPAVDEARPSGFEPVPFSIPAAMAIVFAYAVLVLFSAVRFIAASVRTARVIAVSRPGVPRPDVEQVWAACLKAFGLTSVDLLSSATLGSPVALGVFRRAVILPDRFWTEQSDEVLTAAIGHELAHVARYDFAANLCYEILFVFIGFHPASWLIRRQIEQTREMACDELVTARLLEPRVYARSIFQIAAAVASQAQPGYTLGIFDGSMLEERMRRVLRGSFTSLKRSRLLLATSLSALAIGVLIASSLALTARAQSGLQEHMKRGVAAYNAGDFAAAAGHFNTAVSLEPDNISARLYLGNTLMRDFYRTSGNPDDRLLTAAQQQYAEVLRRNAANKQALAGLSSIALDRKQFNEARQWTEKLATADPDDKTAWYTLGIIDWAAVYPEYQRIKQADCRVPPEEYRIPDADARRTLRDRYAARVDEGMQALRKALALDANYDDAMAYLNLLYRLKAAMTDNPQEASSFMGEADTWVARALEARRRTPKTPPEAVKLTLDGPPPGPAGRTTMVKAPPPPPPPPGPAQSQQIASALPRPPREPNQPPLPGAFWQVVGPTDTVAMDLFRQLRAKGFDSLLHLGSDKLVRVLAGPYFDHSSLEKAKPSLEAAGFRVLQKWE